MSNELLGLLPLIVMTTFFFFLNRWIGKKCNVWNTKFVFFSLIPAINYIVCIFMFAAAIQKLNERIGQLEAKPSN